MRESKNLGDLINNVGQNMDATKWGLQNLGLQSAWLVLMLQYRREVDHKLYRAYESGLVIKDSQTGKYFLQASPFTPEALSSPRVNRSLLDHGRGYPVVPLL